MNTKYFILRSILSTILPILIVSSSEAQWIGNSSTETTWREGKVGIGTNNPKFNLEIAGTTSAQIGINSKNYNIYRLVSWTSQDKFSIYDDTDAKHRFVIDGNGKIGIGTDNPNVNLEIAGTASAQIGINSKNYNMYGLISWYNQDKFSIYDHADAKHRFVIDGNGKIGIGTNNPNVNLEIAGTTSAQIGINSLNYNMYRLVSWTNQDKFSIYDHTDAKHRLTIDGDGNVGIGTTTPDSELTVAGKIHSQEVVVSVDAGADFVFDDSYELRSLEETEIFINENKHLPEIASENEMISKGMELSEMNIKLLQKVEELTLYMIEMNKQIQKLQAENEVLKTKVLN